MSGIPQITDMNIDWGTLDAHENGNLRHVFHVFCNADCVNGMISGASPREREEQDCCVSGIIYKQLDVSQPPPYGLGAVSLSRWLVKHHMDDIYPDLTREFTPNYNTHVKNGAELLKRITDCIVSPEFELATFDVQLNDKAYMKNSIAATKYGFNVNLEKDGKRFPSNNIINLPRLVLNNANMMLAGILRSGKHDDIVSVFFYNQAYPKDFIKMSNLFVLYPIKDDNYQQRPYDDEIGRTQAQKYLNSFFKLFKLNSYDHKESILHDEIVKRTREMMSPKKKPTKGTFMLLDNMFDPNRWPSSHSQWPPLKVQHVPGAAEATYQPNVVANSDYVENPGITPTAATGNWNMTPGTYLRKYILSKFGRSGGRRSCKNGTRRHSKKKGTRRRQGMN